jgi:osmotically-inducible protein OsmY
MKTDKELQKNVQDELFFEPQVDGPSIGVAVKNNIVTLTGTAKNYAEKMNAEKAALRIGGVRGVANEIEVRLPGISVKTDADIAQAALNALKWDATVPD